MTIQASGVCIDGKTVPLTPGKTILQLAWNAGIYIPCLCAHPDLPSGGVCGLCVVEVACPADCQGILSHSAQPASCRLDEPVIASKTFPQDGMSFVTQSETLQKIRKINLAKLLANHPHVCLTCPHRDGCDRIDCTLGEPVQERCCERFGECEVQRVSDYIGIPSDTPRYRHRGLMVWQVDPVISLDLNRCIGCQRCVDVCDLVMEHHALAPFSLVSGVLVRPKAFPENHDECLIKDETSIPGFKISGCKFCGACVLVCPAGAILEYGPNGKRWHEKTKSKLKLKEVMLPPRNTISFKKSALDLFPDIAGVYRLWDAAGKLFLIEGTSSLKKSIGDELDRRDNISECDFEEAPMYTQRANELISIYLKEHGSLPKGNDLDDDLF